MDPSRITLRPFKLSDVDDFLKWVNDDRVAKNVRWDAITTREEAVAHLEKVAIPQPWHHSICLDDRSIGYISLWKVSDDDKSTASIAYATAAEHWGQGIATIALKMALSRVFIELPDLVRLMAYVLKENKRSQRVLEKFGFVKTDLIRKMYKGEMKDILVYGFLSKNKEVDYSICKQNANWKKG
ncbi:putative [ribosomal protein S5]-alanine N-acetyltransferase [Ricinus communis]|uniref:N-acetyltransferase, putative n=1 Tax=Ricinus communis TaxID=3988 RepID=B9RTP2_RICCO|nr:putative [ribosomal protein S5]-alanine N-acetyltransferase [Ricinus communis]EEF45274.1 N-acetyltransferase, putative [Ricinus communis]|eukprot:XP_002517111.1 uncharacterized protein LOC8280896 [Ricinus communis]